jgi:hypothetical protein
MTGHAISIATPDQGKDVRAIERIIRMSIAVSEHPDIPSGKLDKTPKTVFASKSRGMLSGRRRRRLI